MKRFPFYKQLDQMDCGPTCLRMIAKYYGKSFSLQALREKSHVGREGISLLGISDAAEKIGFRTMTVGVPYEKLVQEQPFPCIAHWKQSHFIVVHKADKDRVYAADPASGLLTYSKQEFLDGWISSKKNGEEQGVCLLLEPSPDFYANEEEKQDKTSLWFLFSYLKPYKKLLRQLVLGVLFGSMLQLIFPFLTQAIVDFGIINQDISFIYLVLAAQLVLFISRMSVDFIRSWILLYISSRINISLISDFLIKLMKLPISFFDAKMTGDLMQRIGDHQRIESFLTFSSLNILFSFVSLIVFGIVLAIYSLKIFAVFVLGSVLYAVYVFMFLKKRRVIDFKRFEEQARNQGTIIQLITGMQEIKLNNCEKQKRWDWERIQARLFKINVRALSLNQTQQAGSVFINETKNIIITFLAAIAVMKGEMTLGMMLAVQYIIGQLNGPVDQMVGFLQSTQDAKISMERLGEIHLKEDEEAGADNKSAIIPQKRDLSLLNVSFQYEGPHSEEVLRGVNILIPDGKVTAIVGTSGSGKTTLIKLLLGFYKATRGEIKVGETNLQNLSNSEWRRHCGAVMQDGFIFSDTIANNIALGTERIDKERLFHAVTVANLKEFIERLPLSYNTKIGMDGHGLSQGQKQRILIARAVYKNPEFLFFDEATNALDANNELVIMKNLEQFFSGKTVVVVAHRLSTVKNADQIIVLEKGRVVEIGTHLQLTDKRNVYYHLVKNQLELGN